MKKLVCTLLISLSMAGFSKVQAQENATNPNAPDMVFEKEIHDFGTINYSGNGVYEFKFKNSGKEALVITNAAGSCGCTVPTWPRDSIKAGETGVIKVSYDTKRSGNFTKTVTLSSNAKTPVKVLTIKGLVEPAPDLAKEQMPLKKVSEFTPLENQPTRNKF